MSETTTATREEIMEWYVGQARFAVRWHEGRMRFLVHDTAIGCYWEAAFSTYDAAVTAAYQHKHLRARI